MTQSWILDRDLQPYRFIFYDGIKKLLIIFALLFLASLIFFRKNPTIQAYKRGIMVVVLSAIFVPRTVGGVNYPIAKDDWASCFTEP